MYISGYYNKCVMFVFVRLQMDSAK